jgi:hypothetical protein
MSCREFLPEEKVASSSTCTKFGALWLGSKHEFAAHDLDNVSSDSDLCGF